jgi:hypothetical protein
VLQQNKRLIPIFIPILIPILDTRKTALNRFCGEFRYYVNVDVQIPPGIAFASDIAECIIRECTEVCLMRSASHTLRTLWRL